MTLLESALRLMLVAGALIWLPGWLATRQPLRTAPILHAMMVGTGIHLALLIAATTISQQVDWVAMAVAGGTIAIVVGLAARRIRRPVPAGATHEVTLPRAIAAMVVLCVALAAVLRWFHNYHFDDFQHLVYLTEIERQDLLFPRQFMLHVEWGSVGDRALIVSRYPFWAAHYVVLSRLAGIAVGDGYYLLGLGLLAFTLGLIAALLRHVLSSGSGTVAGVLALLAGGHLLTNDEVLNFGGYPFQSGKLFVLVAAVACLAYARTRLPIYLPYMAIGLFVAPLMHTNNIVGAGVVFVAAVCAAAVLRAKALVTAASMGIAAVVLTAAVAMASGGFMRLVGPGDDAAGVSGPSRARSITSLFDPSRLGSPAERQLPVPVGRFEGYNIAAYGGWYYGIPDGALRGPLDGATLPMLPGVLRGASRAAVELEIWEHVNRSRGIDERAVGKPGNVRGRLALFLKRALPLELLFVLAVIGAHRSSSAVTRRRLTAALLTAFLLVIALKSGGALARQVGTTMFKPGYLAMRQSLQAAGPLIGPQGLLTDPITYVYGSAAGWTLPAPPPFSLEAQFGRLLIFHPDVRGSALEYLLAAEDSPLVVINEAVVGPAVAEKFNGVPGVELLMQTGGALPPQQALVDSSTAALAHVYALDYASVRSVALAHARILWRLLFDRPIYVFSLAATAPDTDLADAFELGGTAGAVDHDWPGTVPVTQRAHLNTVLLSARLPAACFTEVRLSLEGTGTFGSPVLIHLLPTGSVTGHWTARAIVMANEVTRASVPFLDPVCGPGAVTFFIHGDRLYDFRFQVRRVNWNRQDPPGNVKAR